MRTPLNAILTLLLALRMHLASNPRGLEIWKVLQSSSTILQYLVNDLLDLFQIKKGKFTKNEKECNLREEVTAVAEIIKIQCLQKGVALDMEFGEELPETLIADA
jgi:signal transduction histidine kinase